MPCTVVRSSAGVGGPVDLPAGRPGLVDELVEQLGQVIEHVGLDGGGVGAQRLPVGHVVGGAVALDPQVPERLVVPGDALAVAQEALGVAVKVRRAVHDASQDLGQVKRARAAVRGG